MLGKKALWHSMEETVTVTNPERSYDFSSSHLDMRAQLSRMLKSQTGELPTRHETDVCAPVSLGHKEFLFYFFP